MAGTSNLGTLSRDDYATVGIFRKITTLVDFARASDDFTKNPSARTPRTLEDARSWMDAVTKGPEQEEFPVLSAPRDRITESLSASQRVERKSLEQVDNGKSRTFGTELGDQLLASRMFSFRRFKPCNL